MTKSFNWRQVVKIMGALLLIEAAFMLVASLVGLVFSGHDVIPLLVSTAFTAVAGVVGRVYGYSSARQIGPREGYLIVSIVWIVFSFFGMMPFILDDTIDNVTDAFFETMSGFTTTGATILTDIDHTPKGLLFWRSLMQWLGGMGIVVFSMAIFPLFGSGMSVFKAEVTGPTYDKIQPRIKDTARKLWEMYLLFTVVQTVLLMICGMGWFDATCHSLSTVSTGGFSTKSASVGYWASPSIHYIIIFFMFISSINFSLMYNVVIRRQRKRLLRDEEVRAFIWIILITAGIVTGGLYTYSYNASFSGVERCFRTALFNVVSLITSSGFSTCNYLSWHYLLWMLVFVVSIFGGCAGSTAGGVKIIRLHIAAKNVIYEFRRMIHPRAVMPVRVNGRVVPESVVNNVHAFIFIFLMIIVASTLVLMGLGLDPISALSSSISSLSNVGPALGDLGPAGSYANVPAACKWILSFLMLIGRLELFTILLLFSPSFWKR
ncbi:MAG: TrkH family potassium uptake protein [Paludibacteraceae bacterium]|nr:TrkH family potassium uptake protein [Paludibacteraceae bacterium]